MSNRDDMRFSETHQWAVMSDGVVMVGISDHAQQSLGDIVYIEMPKIGDQVESGAILGSIESVKTASDYFSPVSGEIVEVNTELVDSPELVNEAPETTWIVKVRVSSASEMDQLMTAHDYDAFVVGSD